MFSSIATTQLQICAKDPMKVKIVADYVFQTVFPSKGLTQVRVNLRVGSPIFITNEYKR